MAYPEAVEKKRDKNICKAEGKGSGSNNFIFQQKRGKANHSNIGTV
jgi:hypothetical protein